MKHGASNSGVVLRLSKERGSVMMTSCSGERVFRNFFLWENLPSVNVAGPTRHHLERGDSQNDSFFSESSSDVIPFELRIRRVADLNMYADPERWRTKTQLTEQRTANSDLQLVSGVENAGPSHGKPLVKGEKVSGCSPWILEWFYFGITEFPTARMKTNATGYSRHFYSSTPRVPPAFPFAPFVQNVQ